MTLTLTTPTREDTTSGANRADILPQQGQAVACRAGPDQAVVLDAPDVLALLEGVLTL